MDFRIPGTILIWPGSIFHRNCRRNYVRILSQNWGPDFWKYGFQHFCQTLNFHYGFMGNQLGQNDRNDRGIISGVHKQTNFDMCFERQSPCFPKTLDFCFLCSSYLFLFGGQIWEAFIFLEYRI